MTDLSDARVDELSTRLRAAGMAWIQGGTFRMGSNDHYPEEAPAHLVTVAGFWMDRFEVRNRDFAEFVHDTGYVTVAERRPRPEDYPGAPPEVLVPGSSVFVQPSHRVDLHNPHEWWRYVPGASWRRPRGPQSSIWRIPDHPVVHLAWADAEAYACWAGKEIATEAEWEFAARGGLDGAAYAWGDQYAPGGRLMANTWQGEFPIENTRADGYAGTSPVGRYPANGYGLYDMIGNVWEWTSDRYTAYRTRADGRNACCGGDVRHDPGPGPDPIPRKVIKGGSHLCAANYCHRYRPAARVAQPVDTSASHLGLRCILRAPGPDQ